EAKALKDTIVFFGCKDLSKEVGLPVYVDMKTLDVIYGLEARIWVQHWFKTFGANSMSKAPLWMSLMLANTHTDEQGEVLKGKEPNLTQYGVPEAVLYSGQQGPYWNDYKLWDDIKAHNLRPDVTVLPAGTIPAFLNGVRYEEFIRTEGHHHKTNLPEVYENNYGNNIFLLFKVKHPRPEEDSSIHEPGYEEVEDVMAVFAEPGDHVLFPPGYQHITINIGNTPFVMTDWVSLNAQSSFKYIKRHNGAPYWVVKGKDGKPEFIPNPRYKNIPPIRLVRPAAEIPEFGFKKGEPMFDIVKNGQIDKLAFLNDPSQSQEYNRIYRNAFIPCQSQAGFINNKVALWRSHSTKVNDLRTEQVNIEEKLSVALSEYDIGASETSQVRYEFLQGGIENRRPVLIHAPKGDFVLKFIADSRRKAEFVISVIERAISFGIPVPFVYTNRDGKYFTKIGSWYYALEDYISSGVELNFSQASPQHFFSLGRLTALLHNAFLGFRPHGSKPELSPQDIITALSDFDNLENKLQNSPFPQAGELIFLSFTRFIKEQMQHLLREMSDVSYNSLPSSILHGDLSLGNVKWEGSSIIALYDWEKARSSQPRIGEFKNTLLAGGKGIGRKYSRENLIAMLKGYQLYTQNKLSRKELESIPNVLGVGTFGWDAARWFILSLDTLNNSSEKADAVEKLMLEFSRMMEDFNKPWWQETVDLLTGESLRRVLLSEDRASRLGIILAEGDIIDVQLNLMHLFAANTYRDPEIRAVLSDQAIGALLSKALAVSLRRSDAKDIAVFLKELISDPNKEILPEAKMFIDSYLTVFNIQNPLEIAVCISLWGGQAKYPDPPLGRGWLSLKTEQFFGELLSVNHLVQGRFVFVNDGDDKGYGQTNTLEVLRGLITQEKYADLRKRIYLYSLSQIDKLAMSSVKHGALAAGMQIAADQGADIIMYTDGDPSAHLGLAGLLINGILNQGNDLVWGSICKRGALASGRKLIRRVGTYGFNLWVRFLYKNLRFVQDNQRSFKALSRSLVKRISP
ncbi:MAG: glucose-6-phosphate isomerase family protein, partial [Candidatus Omnitrophica bacterium]|nr:glucose-6-phosphate isomerase family protein [Candidatus Omnitrophota bacterium]